MLRAGREERAPLGAALFQDIGKIFLPDDLVLFLILDDGALQPGGEVVGRYFARAEVAGQGHAVGEH